VDVKTKLVLDIKTIWTWMMKRSTWRSTTPGPDRRISSFHSFSITSTIRMCPGCLWVLKET